MSLVDEVVGAHGGLDRWRKTGALRLRLSSGGLAFASKGQTNALRELTATVATTGQTVHVQSPEWSYRFDGATPRLQRWRWSSADIAAFAASALWTYVALPFVLPDLDVEERGRRLVVRFPAGLRTHSPTQVLHIDEQGLIRRHDYTALDFGRWARASQTVGDYRQFEGFTIATRRRVYPRGWPHRPLLVWIDVHSAAPLVEAVAGGRVEHERPGEVGGPRRGNAPPPGPAAVPVRSPMVPGDRPTVSGQFARIWAS